MPTQTAAHIECGEMEYYRGLPIFPLLCFFVGMQKKKYITCASDVYRGSTQRGSRIYADAEADSR